MPTTQRPIVLPIEPVAATPAAERRPLPRWLPWAMVALAAVGVAAAILLTTRTTSAEQTASQSQDVASAAVADKVDLGQDVKAACDRGDVVQTPEGRDLCDRANVAAAQPIPERGPTGDTGATGAAGRGITGTDITPAGDLVISYTDGTSQNAGRVVGREGAQGRGIASSGIVGGRLVLTYTDGKTVDLGQVVGRDGADGQAGTNGAAGATGAKGPPGRGVDSVDQVDGRLVVTYDDGTTQDAGPLPVAEPPKQTAMWCPPGESPQTITYGVGGPSGTACVAS